MGLQFQLILPLLLIALFSIVAIVIDGLFKNKKLNFVFTLASLAIGGISAGIALASSPESVLGTAIAGTENFGVSFTASLELITLGGYAAFFDILFCLAAIMTLFAARPYIRREYKEYNEFYSLVLYSVFGMMIIGHANNLIVLFVGIETMSIAFYILAGYFRNRMKSVEASLKYFLLGAFASGFLVYGMAMIYGASGTLQLSEIYDFVLNGSINPTYMTFGIGLILVGLGFKVAAFPFHQWAPDVYTGSPTVVTAFMSTAGKAAALIAFIVVAKAVLPMGAEQIEAVYDKAPAIEAELNLLNAANSEIPASLENMKNQIEAAGMIERVKILIAIVSALTMLIGNITALVQKNVKRMLAYSSVAHAGYLLIGVVAGSAAGWSGIAFYATAYLFMQIGSFVIVSILERDYEKNMQLDDYAGLSKSHPAIAALMAIFMFSLAGIPPFAGFFGKYYLFTAAIDAGFVWLAIVGVVSSIISIYFYIGLAVQMYFKEREGDALEAKVGGAGVSLALSFAGVMIFGILPFLLIDITNKIF